MRVVHDQNRGRYFPNKGALVRRAHNSRLTNIVNMKTNKHTKQETSFLRLGFVAKKDKDGNILLGNGTDMTNFAAKIKDCKAAQASTIVDKVKCLELNGKYAPKDGCKVVGQNVKGMVNQCGSEVEEVRFQDIEIDIDGFSKITSTCHKAAHMQLKKAVVKYLLKHRIDTAFWTLINRNHPIESMDFGVVPRMTGPPCDIFGTILRPVETLPRGTHAKLRFVKTVQFLNAESENAHRSPTSCVLLLGPVDHFLSTSMGFLWDLLISLGSQ